MPRLVVATLSVLTCVSYFYLYRVLGIAGDVVKHHAVRVAQVVVALDRRVALDYSHDLGPVLRVAEVRGTPELLALTLVRVQVVSHYFK